jgi:hypothetical protein
MSEGPLAADLHLGAALGGLAGHDEHHAGIGRSAVAADASDKCGTRANPEAKRRLECE